jgi:hypothetical protein
VIKVSIFWVNGNYGKRALLELASPIGEYVGNLAPGGFLNGSWLVLDTLIMEIRWRDLNGCVKSLVR